MGRSVPTYRMKLEELIAGLGDYRRALREEDRRAFDALMNRARRHASAAGFQASSDPMETAMLSMLVGLEKDLEELVGRAESGAATDRRAGGQGQCVAERTGEQDERPPAKAGGLHPIGAASLPPPKGGGLLSDEGREHRDAGGGQDIP